MGRKEFWMFVLFTFIITFVVSLIAGIIKLPILGTLVALALIIPSIMADIRRFRDLGISPWWLLGGLRSVYWWHCRSYRFVHVRRFAKSSAK